MEIIPTEVIERKIYRIRQKKTVEGGVHRVPHTRGDVLSHMRSPHAWGRTEPFVEADRLLGAFPTRVGDYQKD
jgi:hypothetical protein